MIRAGSRIPPDSGGWVGLEGQHPAASQALPATVEAAGSLCCSSRWQCQVDAVVLGLCKCPEGKHKPREVEKESHAAM